MKKVLLSGVMLLSVMVLGACGNEKVNTESQGDGTSSIQTVVETEANTNTEKKKEEKKKVEISLESLRNHPVASESDFEVSEYFDGVRIDKYIGNAELVVIPDEINGSKVLALGAWVFSDANVKGVKLSDSVETLEMTFMDDANIKYVICGSGLKNVEIGTFSECPSLETIEFQEGLTTLGQTAISGCENLRVLYIPESVTEMDGMSVFAMQEGFVIQGKTGSKAEEVANQEGYIFEAID